MKTVSSPYIYLKCALQYFGRPVSALTDEQRSLAAEKAETEQRLQQLILRQPEAAQIVVNGETVGQALQVISNRYADHEEFNRDLTENMINEDTLWNGLHDELAVDAVLDLIGRSARRVSWEEVRKYYNENIKEFTRPERRTVRQILITVDESGPRENRRKTSYSRLAAIKKRLCAGKTDFQTEASARSECPSALDGGLLGTLPMGKLYPQLDEALFALPVGKVSDIIETELGFHLLYCDEIQQARVISFDEVRTRLRERLQEQCNRHHVQEWIRVLQV